MNRLLPVFALLLLALSACGDEAAVEEAEPLRPVATADSAAATADSTDSTPPDEETVQAFEEIIAFAQANELHAEPMGVIVQRIAEQLLGRPYVEGLLDRTDEEHLVADLTAFDCVLFNENVLALAQAVRAQDYSYDTYARNLMRLRYRGGEMDGYCSRLHYFSDWLRDNAERGNVRLVTEDLGGVRYAKTINFMGTHRDSYAKLASDDAAYQCILDVEQDLAQETLYYIPQDRIDAIEDQLQAGDLIATATDIEGLDVTHTGFVYKHADGRTGFIHASLSGEVKISEDLSDYVRGVSRQIGILVARPLAGGAVPE